MKTKRNKGLAARLCWVVLLLATALIASQRDCEANTFICSGNPDYFTKRCTVHPYAVTKIIDGIAEKGHLIGCQFKSFTCMRFDGKYQCRDNFGTAIISFDFSMTDLKRFCHLLCNNPPCAGNWE